MKFYEFDTLEEAQAQQALDYGEFVASLPEGDNSKYLAATPKWAEVFTHIPTGKYVFMFCPHSTAGRDTVEIQDLTDLSHAY